MNTEHTSTDGQGNWIAFLFGAIFNLVSSAGDFDFLIKHVLQAVIGGLIFLLFKMLGDLLSPFLEGPKERIKKFLDKDNKQEQE